MRIEAPDSRGGRRASLSCTLRPLLGGERRLGAGKEAAAKLAETTTFVVGFSVGLAAGFDAYARCSRSRSCCIFCAGPSPCSRKRFRPSQHTCLRLKSCPPQYCRRPWKPDCLSTLRPVVRMLRFLARSSSAGCKRIYFRSTHRIDPTTPVGGLDP